MNRPLISIITLSFSLSDQFTSQPMPTATVILHSIQALLMRRMDANCLNYDLNDSMMTMIEEVV